MEKNYQTKCIAGSNYIVTTPELVKVRTMKKKYIEQLPTYNPTVKQEPMLEMTIDYLGLVEGFYVFVLGQKVWKIHNGDLRIQLATELRDHYGPDTYAEVDKILDQIPQVFAE
jgi:hypothetical protein